MTIVRFNDPDGSDLYVHETPEGFVTYVAGTRFDTGETIDGIFDKMSFRDKDKEALRLRLELFRRAGYRIPDRVFAELG